MSKTFLILLALISFPAKATDLFCDAYGYDVPIYQISGHDLRNIYGAQDGAAWIDNEGNPIILYDERLDNKTFVRDHVIAHECAHHKLGHVIKALRGYAQDDVGELAADCMGAKMLKEQLGYGRKEFYTIAKHIKEVGGSFRAYALYDCTKN